MFASIPVVIVALMALSSCDAFSIARHGQLQQGYLTRFDHSNYRKHVTKTKSVPDWLVGNDETVAQNVEVEEPVATMTVRFTNTPQGKDVIVNDVPVGQNLLFIGDQNGVKLPRACRTGLCGSCSCEVQVPDAEVTTTNRKAGLLTVRACSTQCFVPDGMDEMVVDLSRMLAMKKSKSVRVGGGMSTAIEEDEEQQYVDPMARFSGDWEREFKPQWVSAGSSNPQSKLKDGQALCKKCSGKGRVVCYACNGMGSITMGISERRDKMQCPTCVGLKTCGCGYCRGTGAVKKVRRF